MVAETILTATLAWGSGGAILSGRKDKRELPIELLNAKTIQKMFAERGISHRWLEHPSYALGTGAKFIAGTGSSISLVVEEQPNIETDNKLENNDLVSLIAKIQSVFSLNISEVATVLAVQRPTIYAWVNGDSIPHSSNYRRLQHLYNIAEAMQTKFGTTLGKLQKSRNVGGLSLIDLLSQDKLNQEEVVKHMSTLVGTSGQQALRVRSFREMAKAANKSVSANQNSQKTIDHLTGKRVAED